VPKTRETESRTEALVRFVKGVDLLIVDAQYTASEYRQRIGWGHGCLPETVELASKAGVKQLALFHHDPGHDDDQIDEMVQTGRKFALPSNMIVIAASENDIIDLVSVGFQSNSRISAPRQSIELFSPGVAATGSR
jgi:phosphoribosyl 1,2-cyclic phosphodiesterase